MKYSTTTYLKILKNSFLVGLFTLFLSVSPMVSDDGSEKKTTDLTLDKLAGLLEENRFKIKARYGKEALPTEIVTQLIQKLSREDFQLLKKVIEQRYEKKA